MIDMIQRYVHAVTRRLPENIRTEVGNELLSNLSDMLGENPTDEATEKVLKELGHPRDIAVKYQPEERYLISPRWFSDYVRVLKIVVVILILVGFASGVLNAVLDHAAGDVTGLIEGIIGAIFSSVFDGITSALLIVTIIFVVIEHAYRGKPTDWNVKDLPEVPKADGLVIKKTGTVAGLIAEVTFSVILIMILSVYQDRIGLYENGTKIAPFFNADAVSIFVWIFSGLLILGVITGLLKLLDGRFTTRVSILTTINDLLGLVAAIWFFTMPNLIDPAFFTALSDMSMTEVDPEAVRLGIRTGLSVLVVVLSVITVVDLSSMWYKIFRHHKTYQS